jgi:hypothetical protein
MLDKDSEVNGKLSFSGPARIDGQAARRGARQRHAGDR